MRARPVIVVLLGVLAAQLCAAAGRSVPRTEAQLKALTRRIDQVSQQVSRDALARNQQQQQLRAAELQVGQTRTKLAQLTDEYDARRARRAQLAAQRATAQATLERERSALAGQLRAAYMLGKEEPLKLLLNQRDPLQGERLFAYYGYFGRARAGQIAGIEVQVRKIAALDQDLAQEQTRIDQLRQSQQQQLQTLQQARDQRQQVLTSLTRKTQAGKQSLARLKAQQADLEKLLAQLNSSLKSAPPPDNATAFGRLRGRLDWPVAGRVIAEYGATRASGVKWDGVMVAAARGSPVHAVAAGRVVYADWLPGLGLLVIIDHGDGYLSLYGHNDRLYKAAGASVRAGELIAAAGDTGGRSDPALFFEIRHGGKPVDPRPWFRSRSP